MSLTTDPNDPELSRGVDNVDNEEVDQATKYLVLEDKGEYVRRSYVHLICGSLTTMGEQLAKTYAQNPKFYGATYCVGCRKHRPVEEFVWDGTNEKVGT